MILDLFKENWAIEVNNSALPPSATKALSHSANDNVYFFRDYKQILTAERFDLCLATLHVLPKEQPKYYV